MYKTKQGTGLKTLTPKQMLQRLPIALAQVKAGNNSENLLIKSDKLFLDCINQNKLLKKYTITSLKQYNYKNGYFIYELRK